LNGNDQLRQESRLTTEGGEFRFLRRKVRYRVFWRRKASANPLLRGLHITLEGHAYQMSGRFISHQYTFRDDLGLVVLTSPEARDSAA